MKVGVRVFSRGVSQILDRVKAGEPFVGAIDAIHLASALPARDAIHVFVASDKRLLKAACIEGFAAAEVRSRPAHGRRERA